MTGLSSLPVLEGRPLPAEAVAAMADSTSLIADDAALRARFAEDGYLLLRGILDRDDVLAARHEVLRRMAEVGEIAAPVEAAQPTGTSRRSEMHPDLGSFWRSVSEGPAMRRAVHGARARAVAAKILDRPVRPFDFVWLRAMLAGRASPLHFDHVYMNRGTDRVVTTWIPLGDVTVADGPLAVIEGSHRFEDLIASYRGHDVDRDPAWPLLAVQWAQHPAPMADPLVVQAVAVATVALVRRHVDRDFLAARQKVVLVERVAVLELVLEMAARPEFHRAAFDRRIGQSHPRRDHVRRRQPPIGRVLVP